MKKNRFLHEWDSHSLMKTFRIMRITVFLILASILQTFANDAYSQKTRLSLNLQKTKLVDALDEIESKTEFYFLFNEKLIDSDRTVNMSVKNEKIDEILDQLFAGTDIVYTVADRKIILAPSFLSSDEQQQNSVSGKVTDSSGISLPGVAVVVKGETKGTITDVNGEFSISNVPKNAILQFSFMGMITQEIATEGKTNIDVVMIEEVIYLNDVVVVGYGTQKKSDVTGSIVSLKPTEFKDMNIGVTDAIQGRVAGVNVSNGSIIIRGATSINGADPLWIVDGSAGVIPSMDDIESIEVLKDAASTAIYGASGAGGVILVTTKKGKSGKLQIHAKANIGYEMPTNLPDYLSTTDYIKVRLASGYQPSANEMEIAGWNNPSALPNTRWNDLLFKNALKQNYYLNLSGGTGKTKLTSTMEFFNNEEIGIASPVQKEVKFRLASETQFNRKLKITQILNANYSSSEGGRGSGLFPRATPIMQPYDINNPDGGWGMRPAGNLTNAYNPMMDVMMYHSLTSGGSTNLNVIVDYEILKGLIFQANFTGSAGGGSNTTYNADATAGDVFWESKLTSSNGTNAFGKMFYTLNYNKTFAEKHNIGALIGYEASKSLGYSTSAAATEFSVDPAWSIGLGNVQQPSSGSRYEGGGLSQFGRINYAYDGKYMLQATIRRDGYSVFGPDNRFGIFPSVSAGWNVHKESFIADNFNWISNLKLRSGYGSIGNSSVPSFLYLSSWTNTRSYYSPDGINVVKPYRYDKMPNTGIKWETVTQLDIGLEGGLFNNKLNFSVEYYDKKTTDMLYPITLPPSAAQHMGTTWTQTPYIANIGEINNKGYDFMVQYRGNVKDFKFDVALTASTNKNIVVKLSDELNPIIWKNGLDWHPMASSMYRTENGFPMGQMYGYQVAGIFQNQAEIDALNAAAGEGNFYQVEATAPGDFKYVDTNLDDMITFDDAVVIGNPWPKLIYGTNINLSWKDFELNMGWVGNFDVDIYNAQKFVDHNIFQSDNATTKILDSWSPANTDSENPRVVFGDPNQNFALQSSYFIEDGSYLKLKTLYLGYNLPQSVLSKLHISDMKIFVNCYNLFTITKFDGDPELGGGYLERNSYSSSRTPSTSSFMGGVSLTF